jgi:hypothetical protein
VVLKSSVFWDIMSCNFLRLSSKYAGDISALITEKQNLPSAQKESSSFSSVSMQTASHIGEYMASYARRQKFSVNSINYFNEYKSIILQ